MDAWPWRRGVRSNVCFVRNSKLQFLLYLASVKKRLKRFIFGLISDVVG